MIEQLSVKDYVLFEDAQIDFNNGMSVITGETGAGKSLLIDAIAALSGARQSKNMVRKGASKAVLQMVLSQPSQEVKDMLEENGMEDDGDEIIITRIIQDSGKSRILVNSQAATNAFVAGLVAKMVDVHSQMDTISLMNPALQLEMLDRYAKADEAKEKTAKAYSKWKKTSDSLKKLEQETFSDEQLDAVTKCLNEIEQANIKEDELDQLSEAIQQASQAEKNAEDFSTALYLWKKEQGIQDQLYQAFRTLKKNEMAADKGEELSDLYYTMSDLFDSLEEQKDSLAEMQNDLDAMQEREYQIKRMYRKYGGSYEAMMQKKDEFNIMIDRILHRQDLFDRLEKEKKAAWQEYARAALELRKLRQGAIPELQQLVQKHARDLMLEHCVFEIRMSETRPSSIGMDGVEFYASMNPGQPAASLREAASGGELSRLMLALKVVFQAQNGITTLVFDEIDTGVSGKVALAMGSKMKELSKNYQVLCITHLASVAVWADDHYRVAKTTDGIQTVTNVTQLDEPTRLEELSLMTSGSITEPQMESMRQLRKEIENGKSPVSH